MGCPNSKHRHFVPVPWGVIAPSDLEPKGEPEWEIVYRHEVQQGLEVMGQSGVVLGILGVRSMIGPRGSHVPESMAIADTLSITESPLLQSNPRREHGYGRVDDEDTAWR